MNKIMDNDGIWRINRKIHGYLLPRTADFMKSIIEDYQQRTLHGGM